VLLRASGGAEADRRLDAILDRLWATPPARDRVRAMPADVTAPQLGLSAAHRREIIGTADRIVHCAAAVAFDQPLPDALAINALGTQCVLELGRDMPALERIVHV